MSIQQLSEECLLKIIKFGANLDWPYQDTPFLLRPEYGGASTESVYSATFQVAISHVCRRWREIVVHIPYFWTTLHFSKLSHIAKARTFLERCKPSDCHPEACRDHTSHGVDRYQLDILILTVARQEHMSSDKTLVDTHLQEIFDILEPRISLWHSFHLQVRDRHSKEVARGVLGSGKPAPRLEILQLYHFEGHGTPQDFDEVNRRPEPVTCFGNDLPKLKHLSLIGVSLPWDPSRSSYLYQGTLQSLELALHADQIRPSYDVWQNILDANANLLMRLSVKYSGPKMTEVHTVTTQVHTIHLDHLKYLKLDGLDPDFKSNVLPSLCIPASISSSSRSPVGESGAVMAKKGVQSEVDISLFSGASGFSMSHTTMIVCRDYHQHVEKDPSTDRRLRAMEHCLEGLEHTVDRFFGAQAQTAGPKPEVSPLSIITHEAYYRPSTPYNSPPTFDMQLIRRNPTLPLQNQVLTYGGVESGTENVAFPSPLPSFPVPAISIPSSECPTVPTAHHPSSASGRVVRARQYSYSARAEPPFLTFPSPSFIECF
ncbi:hypothetical protein K435DRAFT_748432 [Dendrothele bispora CBS 962.96]|uniref:Uncharacterized protein n=1 Tax=Dendrothele bispora (strain CBS 962.96) TaxID=1314807 RepID=A0A4S8MKL4_DENBC|nr:hypothetical protein K435DRAFT_748432 [Dendrothele bispora CBS 962.96]